MKEREWLSSLFRRDFFSFYVLHVDAGEKSPSRQEIETRNSSKTKNKKYGRTLPGYSKNPRSRTEFSQVKLTRVVHRF